MANRFYLEGQVRYFGNCCLEHNVEKDSESKLRRKKCRDPLVRLHWCKRGSAGRHLWNIVLKLWGGHGPFRNLMGCKASSENTMGAGRELGVRSESGGLWPAGEPLPCGKEAIALGSAGFFWRFCLLAALGLLAVYCLSLVAVSEGFSLGRGPGSPLQRPLLL